MSSSIKVLFGSVRFGLLTVFSFVCCVRVVLGDQLLFAQELAQLAISVSVDVAAPKIIVPVSSSVDKGFLLLDMGTLLSLVLILC